MEGILYRYRCGLAWRDAPAEFGPWQTLWKRHCRYAGDGTWDLVLAAPLTPDADTAGIVNWAVSVDSTIIRAHQHAATLKRDARIARAGPGRARTRPERLRADKVHSSRAIRHHPRARRIVAVIPEPADQQGHRRRRGSRDGHPPAFDRVDTATATSSNAASATSSSGADWPPATTSSR
ncbi:transposase [Streptomyces antimycoticus]|uniref:transposase n=1 Tax=Streptomyces antimycoticus TaxID=68175 RepID=UPI003F4DD326